MLELSAFSTEAKESLNVVAHLQKHRLHISQLQLAVVVLLERMKLHCGDPIGFGGVVAVGKEGLHIANEGACDRGR